jgi:hypothetical protein
MMPLLNCKDECFFNDALAAYFKKISAWLENQINRIGKINESIIYASDHHKSKDGK